MDLQNADCVVSVPASRCARNMFVPFGNAKKIRMVLPYELEAHLPYPADEMLVDFSILDGSEVRGETEVLTVAVERQRLVPILAALAAVKIEPERVTLSGFAAAAWIGRNIELDQTALCLDIGATSGLFVVADARVRLIRTFPLPDDAAARGRAVRSHIRLTMGALNELSGMPKPPAAIFLTGSGIADMNLEVLADALPIEVKPADLTRLLGVPHDDDAGAWDPLRMDGALALVLAEIEGLESLNVYRSQFPGRKIILRYRENLIRTGVLGRRRAGPDVCERAHPVQPAEQPRGGPGPADRRRLPGDLPGRQEGCRSLPADADQPAGVEEKPRRFPERLCPRCAASISSRASAKTSRRGSRLCSTAW